MNRIGRRRTTLLLVALAVTAVATTLPGATVSAATPVRITASPKAATNSTSATFRWAAPARLAVSCRIDAKPFARCSGTSKTFRALKDGAHSFQLRFRKNGKNVTLTKRWTIDTVKPTGGFISAQTPEGREMDLFIDEGTDARSGIATWSVRRRTASLANGACGSFGAPTTVGGTKPQSPVADLGLPADGCVKHELVVTDKAGNSAIYTDTATDPIFDPFGEPIFMDSTPPIIALDVIPSPTGGPIQVSGTVSDPQSGVSEVRVTLPDTVEEAEGGATMCRDQDPTGTWSCTANVPDGTWIVAAVATNNARSTSSTAQENVRVREAEPALSVFCSLCFIPNSAVEGRHAMPLRVALDVAPFEDVTVTFGSNPDVTVSPSTLTFTPENFDTAQSITVTPVDDSAVEGDEAHTITATTASADTGYQGVTDTASYTILDDDSPRVFLITTSATGTVREGGLTATRQVSLGSAPTSNVTVTLASDKGGLAFSPATLTFTPANFATPQTVTISAIDDNTVEGTITHAVTATSASGQPSYNGLVSGSTTITENIDNDRVGVTFTLTSFANEVTEGGSSDTFQVKLGSLPTATVTVAFSTTSECAADVTVSPTSLTFTTLNGTTNQTVTLAAVDDAVDEGFTQTCPLDATITTTDTAYAALTNIGVSVTIVDDD